MAVMTVAPLNGLMENIIAALHNVLLTGVGMWGHGWACGYMWAWVGMRGHVGMCDSKAHMLLTGGSAVG